ETFLGLRVSDAPSTWLSIVFGAHYRQRSWDVNSFANSATKEGSGWTNALRLQLGFETDRATVRPNNERHSARQRHTSHSTRRIPKRSAACHLCGTCKFRPAHLRLGYPRTGVL